MPRTRRRRSSVPVLRPRANPAGPAWKPLAIAAGAGLVVYFVAKKMAGAAVAATVPTPPATTLPATTPRPATPPATTPPLTTSPAPTGLPQGTLVLPCKATLRAATVLRQDESATAGGVTLPAGTQVQLLTKSTTVPDKAGSSLYMAGTADGKLGWAFVSRAEITWCNATL